MRFAADVICLGVSRTTYLGMEVKNISDVTGYNDFRPDIDEIVFESSMLFTGQCLPPVVQRVPSMDTLITFCAGFRPCRPFLFTLARVNDCRRAIDEHDNA